MKSCGNGYYLFDGIDNSNWVTCGHEFNRHEQDGSCRQCDCRGWGDKPVIGLLKDDYDQGANMRRDMRTVAQIPRDLSVGE